MSIRVDLTGDQYGSVKVIGIALDEPGKKKKWLCECSCGNRFITAGSNLRSGHTRHCPQCGYKATGEKSRTHGMTHTKLYGVWQSMQNRCKDPKNKSYLDYGGRGISVCDEWKDPSTFFEWAKTNGYREGLEIDRIDVNGNYSPDNCRWITRLENSNNKRNNKLIEYNGETKTLAQWARFFDVNYKRLSKLLTRGYSLVEAVNRMRTGDRTHRGSKAWLTNNRGGGLCADI